MPRPSKLTPETQEKIVQAIQLGATYELASQYAGIAYNTFNEWMKAGEQAIEGAKREFYEQVTRAQGSGAVRLLARIEEAAKDDWRAAAWKLERRYPREYGRTVQEHKIDDWRSQAIEDIKAGRIQYKDLAQAFDNDLATTLFREAGVPVSA